MYWDSSFLIILPAIIFALIAQFKVKSTFERYSSVNNRKGLSAFDVARKILDDNGLFNVSVMHTGGNLTDNFNPADNVVYLSDSVYGSSSVAAIGVAAHEVGHAIQHAQGYAPMKMRTAIIPITNIGSSLSMPLIIAGLILCRFSRTFFYLVPIGIFLYSAVVLFQIITLPVEFNASNRALKTLESDYILENDEVKMAKEVLSAAAMTYVAATLSAMLSLLRLILISNRRR